ncbi:hypothetical protein HYFRA_00010579 [Hymenoscyphus fraxineus]|uniref:Chitin-binding type-4 domain-containing protein n=1 Tax=Hymenoscyphus fraxineus TaxID=746836 RepID=A0A9N9L4V1_9HELO|nr:hypothetical protein HYFRA_00010579 [Hymenoscyphus fraxineus]
MLSSIFMIALATSVSAHGLITQPPARAVGPTMVENCGPSVAALVTADNTSHVEDMPEASLLEPKFKADKCNLFLCRGTQFEDNRNQVQNFTAGQKVNMKASIPIPHEGPMNVSVIKTSTNKAIGSPLIEFKSYADESLPVLPANNTDFDVTIPTTLGADCTVPGDCVLQWFWFGTGAKQTYESCVDFVVTGGASGAPTTSGNSTTPANTPANPVKSVIPSGVTRLKFTTPL